jgi:phage shock protein PspC (stress-responsive transcriptional regulator)/predicted membrane protein
MNEEPQEPQKPQEPEAPEEPEAPRPDEAPPAVAPPVVQSYAERPRLVRRPEGKLIAGVCTGLGAYTGVDPVAWRIGFVVLGLTTGIGLVGYIVAWLVMPMARPDEPVPAVPHRLNAGRWVGIGAITLGALVFAHTVFGFHTSWFWGVVLIGLGVALWGRDWSGNGHRPRPPTPPGPGSTAATTPTTPLPTPVPPPAPSAPAATAFSTTATAPITRTQPIPPAPRPPAPKRPPSILGRLVVGACALAIGAMLLLHNLNVLHAGPKFVLAVLLAIIGAGLLIGTFYGRARWLIFPGIVIALMLTTVTAIPFNTRGGFGDQFYTPTSLETLRHDYEHSAGPLQLDLSHLKFGGRKRTVNVREGFGPLLVIVPKDVNVIVHGHVQGGPLDLFGHTSAGWDVSDTVDSKAPGAKGVLTLNTSVTFGPLLVDRAGSARIDRFHINGFSRKVVHVEIPGGNQ